MGEHVGSWTMKRVDSYNGYFTTKVVLDLALLDGVRSMLPDDGPQTLDTHLGFVNRGRSYLACLLAVTRRTEERG
jgi:hypothetical protein